VFSKEEKICQKSNFKVRIYVNEKPTSVALIGAINPLSAKIVQNPK